MLMKRKISLSAAGIILAGLLAVSCGKVDFLQGSVWTGNLDDENAVELYFLSSDECRLVYHLGTLDGTYNGQGNNIYMEFGNFADLYAIGVFDGFDRMKTEWGAAGTKCTFRKKK